MDLKKATATKSKAEEERWVDCSDSVYGKVVILVFHDRKDPSEKTSYSWMYHDERLQDLLDKLDEIEGEWRNQKNLTDKEDIPIQVYDSEKDDHLMYLEDRIKRVPPPTSGNNNGFISCEDGCVILKWVNDGKERVYERFDNPKDFSKFRKKCHASLKQARSDAERAFSQGPQEIIPKELHNS